MSSYCQHLYHIVFRTKDSNPTIDQNNSDKLYAYITGIVKNKMSNLYRINGVENHLHILTDTHPGIAPADFIKRYCFLLYTPVCTGGYSHMALSEPIKNGIILKGTLSEYSQE